MKVEERIVKRLNKASDLGEIFEYCVEKVKNLIASLYKEDKIDSIKLQLLMNKHEMPCGYHRARIVYDRLIEDGFLIRDTKNLGAFVNKEYKL